MGNIIVGILFIVGGMSGEFALRGTNSGGGLAVLGVGLIIWGIIQLTRGGKEEQPQRRTRRQGRPGTERQTRRARR